MTTYYRCDYCEEEKIYIYTTINIQLKYSEVHYIINVQ